MRKITQFKIEKQYFSFRLVCPKDEKPQSVNQSTIYLLSIHYLPDKNFHS